MKHIKYIKNAYLQSICGGLNMQSAFQITVMYTQLKHDVEFSQLYCCGGSVCYCLIMCFIVTVYGCMYASM